MTLYDVLGVTSEADEATLRRAYVELARRHHPDVAGGDAGRMRAINEAWATLGDPRRRQHYDGTLAPPRPPPRSWADPADDVADDDDGFDPDDRPIRGVVRLPGWVSLIPVGLFTIAVISFVGGVVLNSGAGLGLALMALVLSVVFFLAAPFIALFASRTNDRDRRTAQ